MTSPADHTPAAGKSRRQFLQTTGAAAVAGSLGLSIARSAHADGSDALKVGLIGCGGRGSGAAVQALSASRYNKLVAMGDAFKDRLDSSLANLKKQENIAAQLDVPPERQFIGFDAYKHVIEAADVVLLTTPPHFRPMQLRAAIEAGKHVFAEKPVAVDAPGVRSVLETTQLAKQKNLAIVSGLCWRYHEPKRATIGQIHEGAIGDVVTLQCTYNTGQLWKWPRKEGWSDMEYQLRNWLYYTWLSGDHNVEQHIHSLDKMAWVMKDEPPVRCFGVGGRQQRVEPIYGNIYDHHAVVYEYKNGVKCFAMCRQMDGCKNDVTDWVYGTKGTCDVMGHRINGANEWRYRGNAKNMYQQEHDELFASIRAGKPLNNGEYMAKSTMLAIMGRMATYSGQAIAWEEAINDKTDLSPSSYEFGPMPTPPVAIPGRA